MLDSGRGIFDEHPQRTTVRASAILAALLIVVPACAVRRTTRVSPAALPPPPAETSLGDLIAKIDARSRLVHTMNATADLEPTAGSIYSGVIKEYHDVKAFILVEAPDRIRMIGQAPVVRTTIFDMASNGRQFKLSIPPKQKFIVGSTEISKASKNSLENLRPQHILDALLVAGADAGGDEYFMERTLEGGRYHDVVTMLRSADAKELTLERKVWFDASRLDIERIDLYGSGGMPVEDVRYSDYQDFGGVRYPAHIELRRPIEDYSLGITIQKATFNQPIPGDRFELQKPEGEQLIELSSSGHAEGVLGQ